MIAERRRNNPTAVISTGCKNHSIDEVRRGLRLASESSHDTYPAALRRAVFAAVINQASELALYLVTEEDGTQYFEPRMLAYCRSLPLWSALVARGWDINQRCPRGTGRLGQRKRLLELVCSDEDLVRWCLDHRAVVDTDSDGFGDEIEGEQYVSLLYPPVLDSVAEFGTVSTFRLLRDEYGAPIGRRTLHLAAEAAAANANTRAMDLVRYLVDELALDVNELDADKMVPLHPGPPLHYAICMSTQCDGVVRFLLESGADPFQQPIWSDVDAFALAESHGNQGVLGVLQEWKDGKMAIQSRR